MRRLAFKYYFFIYEKKQIFNPNNWERERESEKKNYNIKQTFYFTEKNETKILANKIFIITFYTFQIVKI